MYRVWTIENDNNELLFMNKILQLWKLFLLKLILFKYLNLLNLCNMSWNKYITYFRINAQNHAKIMTFLFVQKRYLFLMNAIFCANLQGSYWYENDAKFRAQKSFPAKTGNCMRLQENLLFCGNLPVIERNIEYRYQGRKRAFKVS